MRVTRFNPLLVSGDTQGVYCFCFSFISYWRNDFFSQCTFYIYHSIQWWKLENQLAKLVNINHFKNKNIRIEIGTAVAPLLKADKESGSGFQWNVLKRKPKWLLRPTMLSSMGGRGFWLLLGLPEWICHGTRKQSNNKVRTWITDIHEVNLVNSGTSPFPGPFKERPWMMLPEDAYA